MDVVSGAVSLSSDTINGIGVALSGGTGSFLNIIISFLPWMLLLTVVYFVLRFILSMAGLKSPSVSSIKSSYNSDYSRSWKSYKSSLDYRNRYGLRHYFDKGWYAKKS